MKQFIINTIAILLCIGVFFISSNCDDFIHSIKSDFSSHNIPCETAGSTTHTHIYHPSISDFFVVKSENKVYPPISTYFNSNSSDTGPGNLFHASIFQPPKSTSL